VRGAVADQGVALAQVTAQHAGLIIGAEGAREEAEGVELLEPLAVLHVVHDRAERLERACDGVRARVHEVEGNLGRLHAALLEVQPIVPSIQVVDRRVGRTFSRPSRIPDGVQDESRAVRHADRLNETLSVSREPMVCATFLTSAKAAWEES